MSKDCFVDDLDKLKNKISIFREYEKSRIFACYFNGVSGYLHPLTAGTCLQTTFYLIMEEQFV